MYGDYCTVPTLAITRVIGECMGDYCAVPTLAITMAIGECMEITVLSLHWL